jgi:hypothetical protein
MFIIYKKNHYLHKKDISSPKFKFQIIHTSKSSFFRGLTRREGISAHGLPVVQETGML